jgi:BirA family biotin operon repressor/biotin-[acetyl-CoA-carboxylase] ligase
VSTERGRGWRLAVYDSLPSTSDLCRARALEGEAEGLAVLARCQTQGRGSRGRTWQSPPGNLYLSLLLRPDAPAREAGQWSLLAGVALADALAPLLPEPAALTLKWPNDVLLRGHKLAGILIDSAADTAGWLEFLVVGIGVNLTVAPELPDRPTARLADVAAPPAPEELARCLLDHFGRWLDRRAAEGFAAVRAAWLARGPTEGAAITLRLGEATLRGTFSGLDSDGSLLLAAEGRVRAFSVGEVLTQFPKGA